MSDTTNVKMSEEATIAYDALSSVYELAYTLEGYLTESSGIVLDAKHDSVISALLSKIKSESSGAQEVVRLLCAEES